MQDGGAVAMLQTTLCCSSASGSVSVQVSDSHAMTSRQSSELTLFIGADVVEYPLEAL